MPLVYTDHIQQIRIQSENDDIPEKPYYLFLLLFEFNNFSFLIDIIDNIINMSVSRHQNSHPWQYSIIVT